MSDTQNHSARVQNDSARVTDRRVEAATRAFLEQTGVTYERMEHALAAADAVDAPALAEARQLLADVLKHLGKTNAATHARSSFDVCFVDLRTPWPCPVERARRFLTDQETT